jgi:hypothetical protein
MARVCAPRLVNSVLGVNCRAPALGHCFLGCLWGSRRSSRELWVTYLILWISLWKPSLLRKVWLREDTVVLSLPRPVSYHCFVDICRNSSRKISQGIQWISCPKLFFLGDQKTNLDTFLSFCGWLVKTRKALQSFRSTVSALWGSDTEGISDPTWLPPGPDGGGQCVRSHLRTMALAGARDANPSSCNAKCWVCVIGSIYTRVNA